MDVQEELKLVEKLYDRIKTALQYKDERDFDELCKLIENEYYRVNPNRERSQYGSYAWNLNETLTSEVEMYKEIRYDKRTSKRDKASKYRDFLSDFEQDVSDYLSGLKQIANAPTKK
jgi:hypothetical protein